MGLMDARPGGLSEELSRAVGAGPIPGDADDRVLRLGYVTNQSTFVLTATCGHTRQRGHGGPVTVHSGQDDSGR